MIKIRQFEFWENFRFEEINCLLKELSPNAELLTKEELRKGLDSLDELMFFLFVAQDTEKKCPEDLVGMASIFFEWKCSGWLAEIHDVVVNPAYRGRHIGDLLTQKLLETVKDFAKRKGKKTTIYLTSKPSREAANKMYQKHGFELVAKAKGKKGTNLYKLVITP